MSPLLKLFLMFIKAYSSITGYQDIQLEIFLKAIFGIEMLLK